MFETIEKQVISILEQYPKTRDDYLLYGSYLAKNGVNMTMSIGSFLKSFGDLDVASSETVSRIRRKVQEQRFDLQPSEGAKRGKKEMQLSFIKWSKE